MSEVGTRQNVYHVTLDVFEGPLDLLLRLIERQELDITRISLALVADQYLLHIAQLPQLSSQELADFLVIAAKLLVIKSKSLLPVPAAVEPEDEEDLGDQLARQLAEYKRFKEAGQKLRVLEQRGWHTYLRLAPAPKQKEVVNGTLAPSQLLSALLQAVQVQPRFESVDTVVQPVNVYINDCIKTLKTLLSQQSVLCLNHTLARAQSRLEVIVLFLAVLELIKQQQIQVSQEVPFADIYLEPRTAPHDPETLSLDVESYGEVELE
ncbi:MAG: segregation and condensation protein A [Anaerolineae bacterium]